MIVSGFTRRRAEARATLANPNQWMVSAFGGGTTASSVEVTPEGALSNTAVLASVQRLARTVSALPLITYERLQDGGKERATSYPLFPILHDQPNEEMTATEFREFQMVCLLLRGNSYSVIERNGGGRIIGLWPLRSDLVSVARSKGEVWYHWKPESGGEGRTFHRSEIHHIHGISTNGLTGLSPISLAREAVGLGLAAEEYGARFFGNNSTPAGLLKHPGTVGDEAQKRLKATWDASNQGLSKSHKTAILEEGMDYVKIGTDPRDSQFLETRKFQVREAARFFDIQPHHIGDLDDATFTNIEAQGIEFVVYTLQYWLSSFESAIRRDLIPEGDQDKFFSEFLVDGLLRGDVSARGEFYLKLFSMGAISPNEIRALENMNSYEEGDRRYVPLNYVEVGAPRDQPNAGGVPSAGGPPEVTSLIQIVQAVNLGELGRGAAEEIMSVYFGLDSTAANRILSGRSFPGTRKVKDENRAMRAVLDRRGMRAGFVPLYSEAFAKVIRSEVGKVMKRAEIDFGQRGFVEFKAWLDDFYENHQDFITKALSPVHRSQASAVLPSVLDELGDDEVSVDQFNGFVESLTAARVARHIRSSKAQILKAIEETDPLEALRGKFAQWEETRADRMAKWSTVQVGEAVAKFAISGAGFALVWRSFGDNCPMCDSLNGRTVGRSGEFLSDGETLNVDGSAPFKATSAIQHPPLHEGCDCSVVAG